MTGPTAGARRQAIFDFIVRFKRRHNGIAPTVREIAAEVGISTTSTVNYHLRRLASDGRITYPLGLGVQRAIGVPGFEFTEAASN